MYTNKIIFFLFILHSFLGYSQKDSLRFSNSNFYSVDYLEIDSVSYKDFKSDFEQFRFFIAGEFHAWYANSRVFITMIRSLHDSFGMNKLIFEVDVSSQDFLNAYTMNGNIDSLKMLGKMSSKFILKLDYLKEYNNELSANEKIKIYCIDVESEFIKPLLYLRSKLSEKEMNDLNLVYLKDLIISKKQNKKRDQKQAKIVGEKLITDFENNSGLFKTVLDSSRFQKFSSIINGMKIGSNYYLTKPNVGRIDPISLKKDSIFYTTRESFMFENLQDLSKEFPNDKFYGQFGKFHVALKQQDTQYIKKWKSLTARLSERSNEFGKVCAIDIFYKDMQGESKRIGINRQEDVGINESVHSNFWVNVYSKNSPYYLKEELFHFVFVVGY